MKKHSPNENPKKHLIGGIIVLTIGVLFLLKNFDILGPNLRYYIFSWKTLLIGIGVLNLLLSNNRVGGIILIALGTFFWLPDIFDLSLRAGQLFWPVILIIIGISLLLKKKPHPHFHFGKPSDTGIHTPPDNTLNGADEDYIDDIAIFGGGNKIMTTQHFRGGKMTAIFGGSELNLSRAGLASGRNILNVFFIFGGSSIIVPSNWNVVIEATPIFGSFSDERYIPKSLKTEEGNKSVLIIRGIVMFGGGEIKSY